MFYFPDLPSILLSLIAAETVKRITKDASIALSWTEDVRAILNAGKKMTLDEVKVKLNKLSRVKITSHEYRSLRKAHQNAKNWTARVKKSGLHDGSAQIHELKELLRQHDDLIIAVPEELKELKQTLCGYCICRRPYEGFMIGCDECDEWYHGPCIGVTQNQGDKMEKYVCIRCCVKRVHKTSSSKIAQIVRKWCDPKDLSKARSQDNQKHQRKIREKKREIDKWTRECQSSVAKLQEIKALKIELETKSKEEAQKAPEAHLIQSTDAKSIPTTEPNVRPDKSLNKAKLKEREAAVKARITKVTTSLEQANRKLGEFTKVANDRKATQRREDQLAPCFRYWSAMICAKVLAPQTAELAAASLPKPTTSSKDPSQLLSEPMKQVLMATKDLGIVEYPDIAVIRDAFQCIGWSSLAFDVLMKKPKIDDLRCLLKLSDLIKLPEVKSVGMIRSMISRTSVWRAKVKKALTPIASVTKPFNITVLKDLGLSMSTIPVTTPEELILCNAIADEGERHCVCGGPRDERFMICCVSCHKWFHPKCLNTAHTAQSENSENWNCTFCENGASLGQKKKKKKSNSTPTFWPFFGSGEEDISSYAPKAKNMWPPYGLGSSPEALSALGLALTFKVDKMEKPTPKKPETIDEIVNKAVCATQGTMHSPTQAVTSSQTVNKPYAPVKKPPVPVTSPSKSMLTMRFPSLGAAQVSETPSLKTSATTMLPASHATSSGMKGIVPTGVVNKAGNVVIPNGKTVPVHVKDNESDSKTTSVNTPAVEGLPSGVVQDALLVARSIAENTPILQNPVIALKSIFSSTKTSNKTTLTESKNSLLKAAPSSKNSHSGVHEHVPASQAPSSVTVSSTQVVLSKVVPIVPTAKAALLAPKQIDPKAPAVKINSSVLNGPTLKLKQLVSNHTATGRPIDPAPKIGVNAMNSVAIIKNNKVGKVNDTVSVPVSNGHSTSLMNGVVAAEISTIQKKGLAQTEATAKPNNIEEKDSNKDESKINISV